MLVPVTTRFFGRRSFLSAQVDLQSVLPIPAKVRMKLAHVLYVALAGVGACDAAHPRELLGVWVSDTTLGGNIFRTIDTLILGDAGATRRTSLTISRRLVPSERDTTYGVQPFGQNQWSVGTNSDGRRQLCFSHPSGNESLCRPLRLIPDTQLTLGTVRFLKVKATGY